MTRDDHTRRTSPVDILVAGLTELIIRGVSTLGDEAQVAAIALDIGQEQELVIPLISVTRASVRDEIREELAADAWEEFWIPEELDADQVPLAEKPPTRLLDLWPKAEHVLRSTDEPLRELLTLVAYRLNRTPLPLHTTDDFVAFVVDPDFGDEFIDHLERVARPEAFAALRRQGLIGEREGAGE